ncbi:MAG: hypothetical protein JW982_09900 [Spirochaetes bacterium]|nr:hypothetical protein [Spirochaetota bacterium]
MRKKTIIILLMLITLMSCFNDMNDLIYEFSDFKEPICVIIGAATNGTGRGWANARNDLQATITGASAGDEIWVAGDIDFGTGTAPALVISRSVSLYGGFRGDETKREDARGRSLITGSITGNMLTISGDIVSINGFTFTNTVGNSLYINTNSKVNLRNCEFLSNISGDFGGAINCFSNSILNVDNCIFKENTSTSDGGAIYCNSGTRLNIFNSIFQGNTGSSGGAIYSLSSTVNISDNCVFDSNSAGSRCGAILSVNSIINISNNCKFTGNHGLVGGAILSEKNPLDDPLKSILNISDNCEFSNNYSTLGGAVSVSYGIAKISENCVFNGNYAHSGAANGGAISFSLCDEVIITDCVFINNYLDKYAIGRNGGAILLESNDFVYVKSCQFINNSATGNGGAIYKNNVTFLTLENNYFQGNTPDDVY